MVAQGLRLRATIAAGVGLTPGRKTKIHMSKLAQPNKSVSNGKESACNAGDLDSIPGSGRSPSEGNGNPLQYSCLENSHGQRSLAGYHPWGCKESDTTEQLSIHTMLPGW